MSDVVATGSDPRISKVNKQVQTTSSILNTTSAMPPVEVIDLSLSTDDERRPKSKATRKGADPVTKTTSARPLHLHDFDFDIDFDLSPELTRISKRPRISPPDGLSNLATPTLLVPISRPTRGPSAVLPRATKGQGSDPIVFTSSPHAPPRTKAHTHRAPSPNSPIGGRSDDDFLDFSSSPPGARRKDSLLTERSANVVTATKTSAASKSSKPKAATSSKPPRAPNASKETVKEDRARAREAAAGAKLLSKEATAQQRKLQKEQKAKDKQREKDLAEANKARHDKKVSTPEMIVDLPHSIQGKSVDTKLREMLKTLGVETSTYTSLLPNVVKWRRKKRVEFDEELGHWVPVPERIVQEEFVACLVEAREFVGMLDENAGEEGLDAHAKRVKDKWQDAKVLYLIEGLETWVKRGKNKRNREYQAAARGETTRSKDKDSELGVVSEESIEDALLRLQVVNKCLIHHTANNYETAEWVVHFTQHISTVPYR